MDEERARMYQHPKFHQVKFGRYTPTLKLFAKKAGAFADTGLCG
jgi:hypothetical protein